MGELKIGVLGAGHLGKIHLKCLGLIPEIFEIVGFFDPNLELAKAASEQLGIPSFNTMEELIEASDAVDIVTPTLAHYECAISSLTKGKHVFIEKPITNTIDEAKELIRLVEETGLKLQVGHVERFNPAFIAAQHHLQTPGFIEAHRLSEFNPRGTDVSVVLDLMIHDLDIILHTVNSEVKDIHASGVSVVSDTPDICNARLEFENGSVANLTASRISLKTMRKSRFFQKDAYISVDFFEKKAEIVRMTDVEGEPDPFSIIMDLGEGKGKKEIFFEKPEAAPDANPIRDELAAFGNSILENTNPKVSVHDGFKALETAHRILAKISS
ncbi:MAG: Gfo/Idh/MocA family protein [Flavobacteriales bacterium]